MVNEHPSLLLTQQSRRTANFEQALRNLPALAVQCRMIEQGRAMQFLEQVAWNEQGLVPAIAQDWQTGRVLMVAWMNREALAATAARREAVYFSRSRQKLWHKGEESGHVQKVHEIRLDCDADVIVLAIEQTGGIACHTGRQSCFYRRLEGDQWQVLDPVLKDPQAIYRSKL